MPNQAIQHHQGDQILYHVNSDPLVLSSTYWYRVREERKTDAKLEGIDIKWITEKSHFLLGNWEATTLRKDLQFIYLFFIGEHSSLHSACSDLFLAAKTSSPLYRQVLQQEFVLSSLAVIQVLVKDNQFYESNQFILSEKGLSLKMLADSLGLLQLSEHIFNKSVIWRLIHH